jgi:superoxide reductase
MNKNQRFFICSHCGNISGLIHDKGAPMMCCGDKMSELIPNTAEAATEKHLPVVSMADGKLNVEVGSVMHPSDDGHHIVFVYVETERGGQRKGLAAGDAPKLGFNFVDDKPVAVYAYCNLHGLWKTEV